MPVMGGFTDPNAMTFSDVCHKHGVKGQSGHLQNVFT